MPQENSMRWEISDLSSGRNGRVVRQCIEQLDESIQHEKSCLLVGGCEGRLRGWDGDEQRAEHRRDAREIVEQIWRADCISVNNDPSYTKFTHLSAAQTEAVLGQNTP